MVTTTIWSEVLFGDCPHWIRQAAEQRRYDLYLLLDYDVPWVDDRQRYLPHARGEFFDRCRQALESGRRPYCILRGSWEQRLEDACRQVSALLEGNTERCSASVLPARL